jgi:hypothetical protein
MSSKTSFGSFFILLPFLALFTTPIPTTFAHTIKIAADVGATLHIEPNDNPRAGEPAQSWFALTRKGGKPITLKECICNLAIYAEPHSPSEPALLKPLLKPVKAERYSGTPGAEITFPKPGSYQLWLNGKPATGESFKPFELKFTVTVVSGKKAEVPSEINVAEKPQGMVIGLGQYSIFLGVILLSIGGLFFLVQVTKGRRD